MFLGWWFRLSKTTVSTTSPKLYSACIFLCWLVFASTFLYVFVFARIFLSLFMVACICLYFPIFASVSMDWLVSSWYLFVFYCRCLYFLYLLVSVWTSLYLLHFLVFACIRLNLFGVPCICLR